MFSYLIRIFPVAQLCDWLIHFLFLGSTSGDTNWDTSWLGASIGAFAHADPDTLKQRYTKDGKALESCEDKTKVAYDDLPKDTDKKDDSWLVAAFQTAANRMGGYLGLEDKSIAFGDPSDAYYMLSGKWPLMTHLDGNNPDGDAENLVGGPDTDKDVLFALLEKCNDQPIIFGTGANPDRSDENLQPWTWYGVTNVNYGDPEEGKKPYTDAHIVFWHGKENWEKVLKFGDLYDDIRKVVHFE
uniref:Calpain catalytic domain-containing protein n=1 Tax=Kwoniella bestiolae CBS 10118 TaxID=1296100 RepID=A0A1B9FXV6_9TREE|nr:hypothetical protein I302_06578 [Kwoniella bestiolae CBS 10118]OCF23595.1 hypothetical protein I302_06578 [Kwoniella bestiolae CBS 10118]